MALLAPGPSRPSRRTVLRAAFWGTTGVVLADGFGLEPRWLDVTPHDVLVPGLPRSLEGLTIAQLTDVHLTRFGPLHEAVVAAVRARRPAVVALTGDIVDSPEELGALHELCGALAQEGREVVATLGNWEHWGRLDLGDLSRTYAQSGAQLLGNETVVLSSGLSVVATDDACTGRDDLAAALRTRRAAGATVLLTHAPALLDEVPSGARFDLALAGHTHGGQVRAVKWPIVLPPRSGRFVAGWYETPAGPAYVSRGIGTSELPVRFMCRPELPFFRLLRA